MQNKQISIFSVLLIAFSFILLEACASQETSVSSNTSNKNVADATPTEPEMAKSPHKSSDDTENIIMKNIEERLKTFHWIPLSTEENESAYVYKNKEESTAFWKDYGIEETEASLIFLDREPFIGFPEKVVADKATFEGSSIFDFARDKHHVFYRNQIVPDADRESFIPISANYSKDKNQVFYKTEKVRGADPQTLKAFYLEHFSSDIVAVDKQSVFYEGQKLPDAYPDAFQLLSIHYIKTPEVIYYKHFKIEEADHTSFQSLENEYDLAKDKNYAYYQEKVIAGADLATFEPAGYLKFNRYSKDKNHVYFKENIIQGADPETFMIIESPRCSHFCDDSYSKDKNNVYYEGKKIKGADTETFWWRGDVENAQFRGVQDKNYIYMDGKVLEKISAN